MADARAHAGTSRIEVAVRERRGALHGRVWDNGSNEPARRAEDRPRALLHLSLGQLAERVRLADGDLQIRSSPAAARSWRSTCLWALATRRTTRFRQPPRQPRDE
jgi:signal transduction histidine kinase